MGDEKEGLKMGDQDTKRPVSGKTQNALYALLGIVKTGRQEAFEILTL